MNFIILNSQQSWIWRTKKMQNIAYDRYGNFSSMIRSGKPKNIIDNRELHL